MSYVSDAAVEAIIEDLRVTREKRRSIQNMTRDQLQRYLVTLYRAGFEAGADAIQNYLEQTVEPAEDENMDEVSVAWKDVLAVIAEVKGVGPKILANIDKKLKEKY